MAKKKSKKAVKKTVTKKSPAKKAKAKAAPKKKSVKKPVKAIKKSVKKTVAKASAKKAVVKKPENFTSVNIYLTFDGNCEEAFNYYRSIFGGKFAYLGRFKEMPSPPHAPEMPAEFGDKIMHVSLPISKETTLMGSDSSNEFGQATVKGNNFSISVNAKNLKEAERIFDKLNDDGIITMPLNKTFWGAYFGMCIDKFGIQWMVNFDTN